MTRSRAVGVFLAVLLVFPAATALAKTRKVLVLYDYEKVGETMCVTNIYVRPFEPVGANGKGVTFSPGKHRARAATGGGSWVEWRISPRGNPAMGVTWQISRTNHTGFKNCPDTIDFTGVKARCNVKNTVFGKQENDWTYTVTATKGGCPAAKVDPEIIFKKGSEGGFLDFNIALRLLVLLAFGGGGVYGFRRWRAARAAKAS